MKKKIVKDLKTKHHQPRKVELPEIEKVCLYYEIMSGRDDYKAAWRLAKGRDDEEFGPGHAYYKWTSTAAFRNTLHAIEAERDRKEEELRDRIKNEFKVSLDLGIEENGDRIVTNFRDREQALDWLNQQINLTSDEKMRVDYLKMMSDLSRFKETENKDKEQDIQRFYTPLQCQECELYNRQKKIAEREEKEKN